MSLIRKNNEHDLTDDEISFLRREGVPEEVKHFLVRQHENVGTKVSAYKKVAAAARAEREALMEVRALAIVKGDNSVMVEAERQMREMRGQVAALEAAVDRERERATAALAQRALAVNSGERV